MVKVAVAPSSDGSDERPAIEQPDTGVATTTCEVKRCPSSRCVATESRRRASGGYVGMSNPKRLCVLIVDDDESSRLAAVELFRDDDYLVVYVDSEEAALAELRRAFVTFDLIVLNIRIPGVDGMAVAQTVRHVPRHRNTPILAVSALAHPSEVARILRAGCDACLSNPVGIGEVREAAARLLEEGRGKAALHAFADVLRRRKEQARAESTPE